MSEVCPRESVQLFAKLRLHESVQQLLSMTVCWMIVTVPAASHACRTDSNTDLLQSRLENAESWQKVTL